MYVGLNVAEAASRHCTVNTFSHSLLKKETCMQTLCLNHEVKK